MSGSRLRLWSPVIVYMAMIFYVSSLHEAPLPQGMSDKSAHSLAYIGLGLLVTRALAGRLPSRISWGVALMSVAIAVVYGVSDEFHQMFVAGRSADVNDVYADATGSMLGVGACWLWGILSLRSGPHGAPRHDL